MLSVLFKGEAETRERRDEARLFVVVYVKKCLRKRTSGGEC